MGLRRNNSTMKLLSWNVWTREKIDNVFELITEVQPDILCLQEITREHEANPGIHTGEYLAKRLGYEVYSPDSQIWTNSYKIAQSNAVISKYPIRHSRLEYMTDPYPGNPTKYWNEGRTYIECELELDSSFITIGTTHLSFSPAFEQNDHRRDEADRLLNAVANNTKRFIFAGDLNSAPDSYTVSKLSSALQHCGPDMDEATWTTKTFEYGGFAESGLNWRLDYVFATPDVNVVSSKVINTEYSDHLPLLVEFSID